MATGRIPLLSVTVLLTCHVLVLFSGFFAPYSFEAQSRQLPFAPPTRIYFVDTQGNFHLRPFVYRSLPHGSGFAEYIEDRSMAHPLYFFVTGEPYRVLGIFPARQHLFGSDSQIKVFLLGADAYGRDVLSRLLYGGQTSLFAGIFAATISVSLGLILGGVAGYYGRWIDDLLMRTAEVFLTMPWLYLLLAVRALLPLHIDPQAAFFLLTGVLGALGWARPARLIRGVVLSGKEREYVLAARSFGASNLYLLRRHILPFAAGTALSQAGLYIPQYILAEVTLSFFGLGVSEPIPSWGNMLNDLQHSLILESYWWLFSPAIALIIVLLTYHRIFSSIKINNLIA